MSRGVRLVPHVQGVAQEPLNAILMIPADIAYGLTQFPPPFSLKRLLICILRVAAASLNWTLDLSRLQCCRAYIACPAVQEAMHASMRRQIESLGDEADTLRAAHIQATKAAEALEAAQTVALGRVGASESALKAASAKLIAAESAALEVQQTLADVSSSTTLLPMQMYCERVQASMSTFSSISLWSKF